MTMTGSHDAFLVVLSILIAIFASFTALSLASRIRSSTGWTKRVWVSAAAIALGGGIWSMHFVAMLAFHMPGLRMGYDLGLTLLSLALALGFTGVGFAMLNWQSVSRGRIAAAGLLIGSGVLAMHYVGMAAMRMPATLNYEPLWFGVSVLIALGAATAAVWLASRDRKMSHRLAAAILMGFAIAGMHYAGMRAAVFTMRAHTDMHDGMASVGQTYLAAAVAAITVLILLLALGAATLERLFHGVSRREARTVLRLKIADILRERDTDEALNQVAALMGEHFGVTRTGYGTLDAVEDVFDYDVCWTDGTVPALLGRLPAAAFGIKIVAALSAGETIVIDDLLEAEISNELRTRDTAQKVDTRSILVVPFLRDGRLRTIVYLNDRQPRRWRQDEIAFMEEMAERTRLVIERAAVEEQLRELNATLEARVEARSEELRQAQEALLQSQKMEAVGQLVAGLSHDFNNVLGAVVGAFELIQRRADAPDKVQHFAEAGLQAAQRGSNLTAQLLAFSRSQHIQLQPMLVGTVITALADLLRRTLGPMIALELHLDPSPVPVMADPTQVEMMALNLAINARDAMPDGGRLTISTAVRPISGAPEIADGDYVEIAFADTGTGMDEVTLRRAMEPFFTTKPVGKGTGLGLAQIYGSVRQVGGAVRIESGVAQGTTVRVLLPCTDRPPVAIEQSEPEISGDSGERYRILLVDDDPEVRTVLAAALESLGHVVTSAADGPGALALLEGAAPEVLLLDFAMPGMNGAEVASEMRRRRPELPIIFASGFPDIGAMEAIEGSTAILRKPFPMDALLRTLASIAPDR
ncbi:MHYT domain-containing protein [Sphingomonas kyeonggiensis]|uniref:histidine kinase n=1 Tax=Sphingomonas kyeonggiensis TaxID=1268553 RepID=A0A7W6NYW1_9SPHN|nr:MHYT domain-containing protein [Sphingomonas kyeonggiensis]MBB4100748.1 NO-binding membrane sensor protein with MHYT domain/signal transduction histidine kinase [Sphingomonas kyeonggiensis]